MSAGGTKDPRDVPRAEAIRRHPWLRHLPRAEVVEDKDGIWRFHRNRIVNDCYEAAVWRGLHLNEITLRCNLGRYTAEERMEFYMLLGSSIQLFADVFAERLDAWRRADAREEKSR